MDKWENQVLIIPINSNIMAELNTAGEQGWRPWAVVGSDDASIHIAVTRLKSLISVVPDIQGVLNK